MREEIQVFQVFALGAVIWFKEANLFLYALPIN
jgi:hypothetical protein